MHCADVSVLQFRYQVGIKSFDNERILEIRRAIVGSEQHVHSYVFLPMCCLENVSNRSKSISLISLINSFVV